MRADFLYGWRGYIILQGFVKNIAARKDSDIYAEYEEQSNWAGDVVFLCAPS